MNTHEKSIVPIMAEEAGLLVLAKELCYADVPNVIMDDDGG